MHIIYGMINMSNTHVFTFVKLIWFETNLYLIFFLKLYEIQLNIILFNITEVDFNCDLWLVQWLVYKWLVYKWLVQPIWL